MSFASRTEREAWSALLLSWHPKSGYATWLWDSIHPRLVPDIEIAHWRKTHVLVVQVYPSAARPHYLSGRGPEAGIFVRLGLHYPA